MGRAKRSERALQLRRRLIHDWERIFWFIPNAIEPHLLVDDERTKWIFWRDHFRVLILGGGAALLLPFLSDVRPLWPLLLFVLGYGWFLYRWARHYGRSEQ